MLSSFWLSDQPLSAVSLLEHHSRYKECLTGPSGSQCVCKKTTERQVDTAHMAEESTSEVISFLQPAVCQAPLCWLFVCALFPSTTTMFIKSVMDGGRDQAGDAKSFLEASYYKQDSAGEDSVLS